MKIGVVANRRKAGVDDVLGRLHLWARNAEVDVLLLGEGDPSADEERNLDHVDFVVSLGGDGTLLRAARLLGDRETPLLGVNLGSLGFLTEVTTGELEAALSSLTSGDYSLETRMKVAGTIQSPGRKEVSFSALNDVVITRAGATRIGHFQTYLGSGLISRYTADGLILSTPTGSTAYNLSAGGPLVDPTMRLILMTPICPHTLGMRPLILPEREQIHVEFTQPGEELRLTVDGQESFVLGSDAVVRVTASAHSTRLLRTGGADFYDILRRKLYWGKRE